MRSVRGRPWELAEVSADDRVARLENALGLQPLTARVLVGRGIDTPEAAETFLQPTLDGLHSPFAFADMEAAVDRLLHALRHGERIVVHGDYDVDGISGTVLLVTVLRALGADVGYILPHRIRDGYGLQPAGVDRASEAGARLLIAVDCGVTAHAAAARAVELGIDLVIVDHHLPQRELPPATALLNPRVDGCGYPEHNLAAVAVAFKLARGLMQRHSCRMRGNSLLKLVALGTIADVVPLVGENRVMAHHGLATLLTAVNPGLLALLKVGKVRGPAVSASDISFRLAPRINAAGRLGDPADAAELFLASDQGTARRLALGLDRLNTERQQIQRQVVDEALMQEPAVDAPVVLAIGEGWHRGVIGIVASRLVEHWGRPAAVITVEGDQAFGSARSTGGVDIVASLATASELLQEYGGHREAAGFRLSTGKLEALRETLSATMAPLSRQSQVQPLVCEMEVTAAAATIGLALELERLGPFGRGNRRPMFLWREMRLAEPAGRLGERHLLLRLQGENGVVEAVGWRMAEWKRELRDRDRVDMVATLNPNRWAGRLRPRLEIADLRPQRSR